jgi:hypothetical protein
MKKINKDSEILINQNKTNYGIVSTTPFIDFKLRIIAILWCIFICFIYFFLFSYFFLFIYNNVSFELFNFFIGLFLTFSVKQSLIAMFY